jgi:hypothetical protein|tara:strand:+ start:968 stop:1300 length:333 start_codon:yes stop_codon:yes gene_type:complete
MNKLTEEDISPIVIDLTNKNKLDESWLRMMGFGVKAILNRMFGGVGVPVELKGNKGDIASFTKAVGSEKKYMDSIRQFGLDNPKTFKNKKLLQKATTDFTRKTGIQWPFK